MNNLQEKIIDMLPRVKGHVRREFIDLDRKLRWFKYSDDELNVLQKHVSDFVKAEEQKRIAKEKIKERIKQEKKEASMRGV